MIRNASTPVRNRLRTGALDGLYYGGVFAGVTAIAALVDGERLRERLHAPPWSVVVFYLVAGVALGVITGLCKPLLRSRFSYLLFGFVIAIPACAAAMLIFKGWTYSQSREGLVVVLVMAALLGPMTASTLRVRG